MEETTKESLKMVGHGKGKTKFSYGAVYQGEFKDGKRNGQGKYTYSNGNIYEGEFVNGKPEWPRMKS